MQRNSKKLYLKEENNDIELTGVSQRHLKDIQHSQIMNKFQISLFNPIEELEQNKFPFSSIGSSELDWFIR
ncbi:hypothetical protein [Carnobacterium maltaromaticum]|uniref:hypothetical protein n=1 Tax=Carnobacterium maltaromaticum TaxID=2751 RepID=UPI00191BC63E|nr:hypothetical protein [Carnobacterium maltaromaticum]